MEAMLVTISLQLAPLPLSAQQQAAVLKVTAAALVALTAARLIEGLKSSAPAAAASAATGAAGTYPQPRSSAAAVGSEAPLLRWERRRMNSVAPSAAPRSPSSRRFQAQQRPSVTHAALGPAAPRSGLPLTYSSAMTLLKVLRSKPHPLGVILQLGKSSHLTPDGIAHFQLTFAASANGSASASSKMRRAVSVPGRPCAAACQCSLRLRAQALAVISGASGSGRSSASATVLVPAECTLTSLRMSTVAVAAESGAHPPTPDCRQWHWRAGSGWFQWWQWQSRLSGRLRHRRSF